MDPSGGDELVEDEPLEKLVASLSHPAPAVVVSGLRALRSIAGKKEAHATAVVAAGALVPMRALLESFHDDVKEETVRTLRAVAAAGAEHAGKIIAEDDTLAALAANCNMMDASLSLRAHIVKVFESVCAYGAESAGAVLDCGGFHAAARVAEDASAANAVADDGVAPRAAASAFACLATMARHSDDLAAAVVDAGCVPCAIAGVVNEANAPLREATAATLRELAMKTPALAETVASDGGVAALVQCANLERGTSRSILAVQTLGYIADFKQAFAMAVVGAGGAKCLVDASRSAADVDAAVAAAWALGCVARHGKETAKPLAKAGALKAMLECYALGKESVTVVGEALTDRAKAALKSLVKNVGDLRLVEPLIDEATPKPILRHVLNEFAVKLAKDVNAKRDFVTGGALMRLQAIRRAHEAAAAAAARAREEARLGAADAAADDALLDERTELAVTQINHMFPADVVSYYLYC